MLSAYVLWSAPGHLIEPLVAAYLLVVGAVVLKKAFGATIPERRVTTKIARLGFAGGFLDAVGGGGWGPVVTSTLVARGNRPSEAVRGIDSVAGRMRGFSLAETYG